MDEEQQSKPKKKPGWYYRKNKSHKKEDIDTPLVTHKCVDCGAITPDHRCPKCLAKWRIANHVVLARIDDGE